MPHFKLILLPLVSSGSLCSVGLLCFAAIASTFERFRRLLPWGGSIETLGSSSSRSPRRPCSSRWPGGWNRCGLPRCLGAPRGSQCQSWLGSRGRVWGCHSGFLKQAIVKHLTNDQWFRHGIGAEVNTRAQVFISMSHWPTPVQKTGTDTQLNSLEEIRVPAFSPSLTDTCTVGTTFCNCYLLLLLLFVTAILCKFNAPQRGCDCASELICFLMPL